MAVRARAALVAVCSTVLAPVLLVATPSTAQALNPGQIIERTLPRAIQSVAGWDAVAAAEGLTGAAADALAAAGAAAAGGASIGVGTALAGVAGAAALGAGVGYAAYHAPSWGRAQWIAAHINDVNLAAGSPFDWSVTSPKGYHSPKGSIQIGTVIPRPDSSLDVQYHITIQGTGYVGLVGGALCGADPIGGQAFTLYGGEGGEFDQVVNLTPGMCGRAAGAENPTGFWALSVDAQEATRVFIEIQRVPNYRIHTHLDCITTGGEIVAADAFSSPWVANGELPVAPPAATCPAGSHVVGVDQAVEQLDPAPGTPREPIYTRRPSPRETDVNDPLARCLALAGATRCRLETEPDYHPVPAPVTGKLPAPRSCKWGGLVLPVTECIPARNPAVGETPETPPDPGAPGGPEDADGADCWPSGWAAFNPAQWVLQPIRCAFVPSPDLFERNATSLSEAASGTAIGQLGSSVVNLGGAFGAIPTGSQSCHGLGFGLGAFDDRFSAYTFEPFYTCDGPTKTLSDFFRPWLVGGIWLGALASCVATVGSAFGVKL